MFLIDQILANNFFKTSNTAKLRFDITYNPYPLKLSRLMILLRRQLAFLHLYPQAKTVIFIKKRLQKTKEKRKEQWFQKESRQ